MKASWVSVLGIRDVPDNPVYLDEDTPQMFGNKAVLPVREFQARLDHFTHQVVNSRFHRFLKTMTPEPAKRGI